MGFLLAYQLLGVRTVPQSVFCLPFLSRCEGPPGVSTPSPPLLPGPADYHPAWRQAASSSLTASGPLGPSARRLAAHHPRRHPEQVSQIICELFVSHLLVLTVFILSD